MVAEAETEFDDIRRDPDKGMTCTANYSGQQQFCCLRFVSSLSDKSDALNPKITLVLLNQDKFLSYRNKSFFSFLFIGIFDCGGCVQWK